MAWPFPEYIRPLMRSVLWYLARGLSKEEVAAVLEGPPHRFRASDVAIAIPEALRSLYFREELSAADPALTPGQVWAGCAQSCFERAYGRPPQGQELGWYKTRPGSYLGMMFETQSGQHGTADYRRRVYTANVPWDHPIEEITGAIEESIRRGGLIVTVHSPEPAPSGPITINIIGGALVPRIDPTFTITEQT